MSGIYGPLWRILGPSPEPPVYSLLTSARVITDVDEGEIERWTNGVQVYPYPAGPALAWDSCAPGSEAVLKGEGGIVPIPEFGAMVVYLAEQCSSFGIFGAGLSNEEAQRRFTQRALAAFQAVESAAIEREFLQGDVLGNNPHLSDGNGEFPWGDTATSVVNGVALLEDEIAKSGRRGMIHLSPAIAVALCASMCVSRDEREGKLKTINGTIVVPGQGYRDGGQPDGHAAPGEITEEWAYATGPVEIRRSEPIITPGNLSEALDRETNTITYRVERYYVVDWDTVIQAAVLIDRCTTACGSAP